MAEPQKEEVNMGSEEATGDNDTITSPENDAEPSSYLPKEKGLITANFYNYEGFWYDAHFLRGVIWAQQNFKARATDILLATFPKTGLTWLKALSFALLNRNNRQSSSPTQALLTKNPHEYVPYIEFYAYEKDPDSALSSLPSPRLLSTHVPYTSLPRSVIDSNCRIVCIIREPKDVFVSMWSFISKLRMGGSDRPTVTKEEFCEMFCRGKCLSGPYWDHALGYLKASLDHPDKVLMLKYEDLKYEPMFNVEKLAKFLGCPFSSEEIEKGLLQDIIELCSIDSLKKMEVNKSGDYRMGTQSHALVQKDAFFRRGVIGDWKNHLSKEMIEQLDQITKQKFKSYNIKF